MLTFHWFYNLFGASKTHPRRPEAEPKRLQLGLDVLELNTNVVGLDMDVLGLNMDVLELRPDAPRRLKAPHRIPQRRRKNGLRRHMKGKDGPRDNNVDFPIIL